ncbi:hypothetical protein ANANG_G00101090, partial [Anguilla anguilla]
MCLPKLSVHFKSWNALHVHLNRVHANQSTQELLALSTFSCQLCSCNNLSTEKDFFGHISTHLKNNETVNCVFEGCNFQTNVYGTFQTHRNRKHNPHTLTDFKRGVVTTTEVSQQSCSNFDEGTSSQVDAAMETDSGDAGANNNLHKVVVQNFAASLLKLEHITNVPGKSVDEFLGKLHYMLSSATLPLSINILADVLCKHGLSPDKSVLPELTSALFTSNPIMKAIGKGGSLSTTYLRQQYYKESFNIDEPVECILNARENKTFQYVPVLKLLRNLLDRRDVVDKIVDNHRVQQSSRLMSHLNTYRSFEDGASFLKNNFLSGSELRILLTFYVDDFE